jgi:2-phosphoglycerate kinase
VAEVEARSLGRLTYRHLRLRLGEEAARRYLILVRLFREEWPIVVLIGGAPGTGKRALATEVAQRLGVARIQSSDLLREVMRMMIPKRLMPVLHRSSYDAWRAIPRSANGADEEDAHLIDGYRAQAELLRVPCEAVIKRSLHERSSLILEGVHVNEALVEVAQQESGAIVIPILLAVLNKGRLSDRFRGRGDKAVGRRAERYMEHFDSIWRLQSYLLSQADRQHVPIIVNDNQEQVIREAMAAIVGSLSARLDGDPKEVFGRPRT